LNKSSLPTTLLRLDRGGIEQGDLIIIVQHRKDSFVACNSSSAVHHQKGKHQTTMSKLNQEILNAAIEQVRTDEE
jgi:hypothetical protein